MSDENDIVALWGMLLACYVPLVAFTTADTDHENESSRSRYRPAIDYERQLWSLETSGWGDRECLEYLRFTRAEITLLIQHLRLEQWLDTKKEHRYARSKELALCMLLYRLAGPVHLKDMMQVFGISRSQISSIVNDLATYLHKEFHEILHWDSKRLSREQLQIYANVICDTAGVDMVGIWGFIDGTICPIAKPTVEQHRYYSGDQGYHGIKFQSIVTPDGLVSSIYGPELSPEGHWKLWQESGLEGKLRTLFQESEQPILYLYGNSAYGTAYGIIGPDPIAGHPLTPEQQALNVKMSGYRIVVESGFDSISDQFAFAKAKHNQQVGQSPVAINYMVSVLLYNCQTCLRQRNQISERFGNRLRPPSLESYLHSTVNPTID